MRARPLTRRDASLAQLSLAESTEERDRFRLDKKGLEDQLAQLKLQAGFHAFVPDSVWRSQLLPALPLACAQLAHLRAAVDDNEVERDHLKQVGRPRNAQRRAPPTPDVATASRAMAARSAHVHPLWPSCEPQPYMLPTGWAEICWRSRLSKRNER